MDAGARATLRDAVVGAVEVEETGDGALIPWRLTAASRRFAPPSLRLMARFTAGVRLALRTDADRLEIDADLVRLAMRHLGRPAAPARLVVVEGAQTAVIEVDDTGLVVETLDRRYEPGPAVRSAIVIELGAADAMRDVDVWLPHDAGIALRDVRATRQGSPAHVAAQSDATGPLWLHHGSSISHGGSASLPTGTWPARAAAALGARGVNLGFGGNAMLDSMTARSIAAVPADIITLKFGINIAGADAMRRRTFSPALHGFLDLVREGHPDTPVVLITAIGCPALEHTPGPAVAGADGRIAGTPRDVVPGDGTLTVAGTRELVAEVVAERQPGDPELRMLDGRRLLAPEEGDRLPDGLHPDDAGYALMAERFAALARDPGEALGAAFARARERGVARLT